MRVGVAALGWNDRRASAGAHRPGLRCCRFDRTVPGCVSNLSWRRDSPRQDSPPSSGRRRVARTRVVALGSARCRTVGGARRGAHGNACAVTGDDRAVRGAELLARAGRRLRVVADPTRLTVQPIAAFSRSANPYALIANDPAVGPARTVAWHPGAGTLAVRIGRWPSGVYFVRVRSPGGQVVAPVVVRPARLGQGR